MPSRRALLERVGVAVVAAASAGCLGSGGDGTGQNATGTTGRNATGGETGTAVDPATTGAGTDGTARGYADRLYDPAEVLDVPNHAFVAYDLGVLYDNLDAFPAEVAADAREYDERYDSVSVPDLGRMTAQVYWAGDLYGVGDDAPAAGSVRVEGPFDPDGAIATLRSIYSGDRAFESRGTYAGYDLYDFPLSPGLSGRIGLREDGLVGGGTADADPTGRAPLEAAVDADGGYADASEVGRRLVDALGEADLVAGARLGSGSYFERLSTDPPESVASGLRAVGAATTFESSTARSTVVGVYAPGEAPPASAVRQFRSRVTPGDGDSPPDVDLSVDDRTVTATLSAVPGTDFEVDPLRRGRFYRSIFTMAAGAFWSIPGR